MGQKTNISWCDYTFNPWWGCEKVSPGCAQCYADAFALRCGYGGAKGTKEGIWGKAAARRFFGEEHWEEPVKWDAEAENWARGKGCRRCGSYHPGTGFIGGCMDHILPRPRVFCASMGDWLEDREDLVEPLARLLGLIQATPHLDWLLLTKRPENWKARVMSAFHFIGEEHHAALMNPETAEAPRTLFYYPALLGWMSNWIGGHEAPANVWVGTTVENQEYAERRIPELLKIPARVRFLSVEPMLGPVDLKELGKFWDVKCGQCGCCWLDAELIEDPVQSDEDAEAKGREWVCPECRTNWALVERFEDKPLIDWVICGGESGGKRRRFEPVWASVLAYQCEQAGVPFFMKQDGGLYPGRQGRLSDALWATKEFPRVGAKANEGGRGE